ncbi:hypothetical protein SODALDRAFT_309087 [Sodiomyces alkalinus F11]|uniref:NACHT domain-containing protein n=1 Tax=Sodiomyces alkalinus (strain CBS 110278 / VKM F-3762 / F11) TaxID=1314773 RepID=A0A3N2PYS5_SODAK|nr:hypothetical protein SODALDRAFT_309087 [Sodiomyces alkalinus F11]ROT39647.1 hypothetical protein SODALDRAFT_309087 [Sodiomyces alkalinus F11]
MKSEEEASEKDDAVTPQAHSDKWADALEKLSVEDRKRFDVTGIAERSPKDVLADVLEATEKKKRECMRHRWKITIKGRTIILRDVLEKITVWVNKFSAIGKAIAGVDPVTAGLPWAAVCFILQTGLNDVEIFGFVLQSVEGISNLLASTAIFEGLYLNATQPKLSVSDKLSENVISLYATVLQFLSELLHYYSQRTATRFIKSVAFSQSDFEAKYEPVKAAKQDVWELATLAEAEKTSWALESLDNMEETQRQQHQTLSELLANLEQPIDRINTQLDLIQDGLERESRIQILRSISAVPYATHHKAARKGRLEGSGRWLLNNKAFQAWRSDSTSSVLWLHGIPGSGKTKLASLVVDELPGSENMAYFYCMRNPAEPLRGQCNAVLASLVRQLASTSADSPLLSAVVNHYRDALDGMAGFDDFAWTSDESSAILLELLEDYPAVTLVFDAMDEVNPEDRQELMDILSELLREAPNLLKIFVSSRENYDIALHFEGSPNIYIDAQDNRGDIESFIDDRLTAAKLLRGRLPDTLRLKIADTLLEKAHGMFRWVDLQIQSLRPLKVAADIEARLGVLPATLEESYWDIYQDILSSGEHATDLAIFTFQWVMYAKGSIEARHFANFASCALSSDDLAQTFTETEIIDVCANLVVNRSGVLEFAHLSVREFLENLPKRSVELVVKATSHGRIAAACIKYIAVEQSKDPNGDLDDRADEPTDTAEEATDAEKEPKAAAEKPTITVEEPEETVEGSKESAEELQNATEDDDNNVPETPKDAPEDGQEPEDGLKENGGPKADEEATITITMPDKTMLEYASRYWPDHASESGSCRMEKPLQDLIRGLMMNDETKTVANCFKFWARTMRKNTTFPLRHWEDDQLKDACEAPANPIWLACFHGWLDVIEYLYGINYEDIGDARSLASYRGRGVSRSVSEDEKVMSPLLYAVATGNFPLAECLVNLASDVLQTKAQTHSHPLVRAAEDGEEKLFGLLLHKEHGGLDMETEALTGAAKTGKIEIFRICLDYNPELVPLSGRLIFFTACKNGHLEIVVFLLERGVNADEGACLTVAALHGHSAIVKELLRRKVGEMGKSKALIAAISNGDEPSINALRDSGAEKEPAAVLRATREDTPLTALRLIEYGFQVRGRWAKTGRAPLHYASLYGRDKVVAAILHAGAPVEVYDSQGQTPLHLAARRGNTECARVLLDHGADVLATDDQGQIPLDLAEDSNPASCEILIRERMEQLLETLTKAKNTRETTVLGTTDAAPEDASLAQIGQR